MLRSLSFVLSLIGCVGCSPATTNEIGLQRYVQAPEHGLIQSQEANGITVTVQYQPAALLAYAERQGQEPNEALPAPINTYANSQYFVLSLNQKDGEVLKPGVGSSYNELLQALAFRIGEFSNITTGTDTLRPNNAVLDRTFGMGPSTRMLVAFPISKRATHDVRFHLKEFGLGCGALVFDFRAEDIMSLPALVTPSAL